MGKNFALDLDVLVTLRTIKLFFDRATDRHSKRFLSLVLKQALDLLEGMS